LQENIINYFGFEVLIAVATESAASGNITRCDKSTDVLEEYIASIFRVEE
jgi:hypothetical protein